MCGCATPRPSLPGGRQVSDKVKSSGAPYRDVTHLEPLSNGHAQQATSLAELASTEVLTELRTITYILRTLTDAVHAISRDLSLLTTVDQLPAWNEPPTTDEDPAGDDQVIDEDPTLRYADGLAVTDNQTEIDAYLKFVEAQRRKPGSIQELRKWHVAQFTGGDNVK